MNILHISCIAPPDNGGIGQVAFEEVRRLRARGHEATLMAPVRRASREPAEDPIGVKRLPTLLRWRNAAVLQGIERFIGEADVVHLHYPFYGTAETVAQTCIWKRKPLVMTFHMDPSAPFPLGVAFGLYRMFAQPAIVRACKRILVSSRDYAEHSSLRGFMKAHPERVRELPFGVDIESFECATANRERFGIPDGVRVAGFFGVMDAAHAFKGLPFFLDAMASLPKDVHALIVGGGDLLASYQERVEALGIADRCHFTGRLATRADIGCALKSMDIFTFPSYGSSEAFGLVVAEALSLGVPVVASDLPGVRTVVRDHETGILVPPRDVPALAGAIRELLDNDGLRQAYAASAAEDAQRRFSWDRHVDALVKEYECVV
jgi:glycosyltransferase involved in cell wall biosynthesis